MMRCCNKKILSTILVIGLLSSLLFGVTSTKVFAASPNPWENPWNFIPAIGAYNSAASAIEALNSAQENLLKTCQLTLFPSLGVTAPVCAEDVLAWLAALALTVTGLFLALAGIVLNYIITFTVVLMRANISGISGINAVWEAFRDVSNMLLIFILLYIAIGTVLNLSGVNMKKTLRNVILVALLMNFSLFFTKVMIDASNIVALGFYNNVTLAAPGQTQQNVPLFGDVNLGLSGVFMNQMGLATIWDIEGARDIIAGGGRDENNQPIQKNGPMQIALIGFMGSILFLITGFIFFAAAAMFLSRYVVLILLMMFSPLAFASMALPSDKYSSMFWSMLMKQLIFAPVFMGVIWAAVTAMGSMLSTATNTPGASATQSFASSFSNLSNQGGIIGIGQLITNFGIIIALLAFALLASQKLGASGASWGMSKIKGVRKGVQNLITRTPVRAATYAGGNAAKFSAGWAASATDKGLANTNIPFLGNSRAGRWVRSKTTGAVAGAKFGTAESWETRDKRVKKLKSDIKDTDQLIQAKKDIKAGGAKGQEALLDSSNKALETLDIDSLVANAENLKVDQLDHLLSDKSSLSESAKTRLRNERFKKLRKEIENAEAGMVNDVEKIVKGLNEKEFELMGSVMMTNQHVVEGMKGSQYDSAMKSNKYTNATKDKFKAARTVQLDKAFTGPVPATSTRQQEVSKLMQKIGKDQMAKLTVAQLTSPGAIERIDNDLLKKLPEEKSDADRHQIRLALEAYRGPGGAPHGALKFINGAGSALYP